MMELTMESTVLVQDALRFLLPEAFLLSFATLLFFLAPFFRNKISWGGLSVLGCLVSYLLLWSVPQDIFSPRTLFVQPVLQDQLSAFIRHFSFGMGLFFILLFWNRPQKENQPETFALILFMIAGSSLVSCANDMIILFLGLELISIPSYILLFMHGEGKEGKEATLKYFYLSILFAGILLLGFSYLFGLVGSTNISLIQDTLIQGVQRTPSPILIVPVVAIIAGLGYKVSLVPFHFYAPDVYQGTSYRAAAVLATVPKIAGFVGIIRLFGFALVNQPGTESISESVSLIFWILAAVTMSLGSVMALLQRNVGRVMAYSSISHSGYVMIALSVAPKLAPGSGIDALGSILFYLFAYFFATFGVFAVLELLHSKERKVFDWDDLAGTSVTNPWLAGCLVLFLFSLTGIPLTAGFLGKFLVIFSCASVPYSFDNLLSLETHNIYMALAIVAVVNAAIGAWFYLKIISGVYFKHSVWPIETKMAFKPVFVGIGCAAIVTVILGVFPSMVFKPQLFRGLGNSSGITADAK